MDTGSLKASIVIPVNNRAEFIGTAIESVLTQTIQDVEVLIMINGGENDPTIAKVKEYMVKQQKKVWSASCRSNTLSKPEL